MIDRSIGLFVSLFDWLFHWLIDWLIDLLIDWLIDWLTGWLIDGLIDWLNDRLIVSLIDRWIDWRLIDGLLTDEWCIVWLLDRLIVSLIDWFVHVLEGKWFAVKEQVKTKQWRHAMNGWANDWMKWREMTMKWNGINEDDMITKCRWNVHEMNKGIEWNRHGIDMGMRMGMNLNWRKTTMRWKWNQDEWNKCLEKHLEWIWMNDLKWNWSEIYMTLTWNWNDIEIDMNMMKWTDRKKE